jgi:hypothetical protein
MGWRRRASAQPLLAPHANMSTLTFLRIDKQPRIGALVLTILMGVSVGFKAQVARTVQLSAGSDLQAALDAARPGDVLLLPAGATFTGNFVLPRKDGSDYITLRTANPVAGLQAGRVSPDDSPRLAKLRSPNGDPALSTAPGAQFWRIQDLEFLPTDRGQGTIIRLGSERSLATVPHDLVFQRVLVRGDSIHGQRRGIALNSASTTIRDSYIAGIRTSGFEAQAICGWNGPGPFLIENNYLEGATENLMFGGADPEIPNLVPSDITIRGNHFAKPLEWRTGAERGRWVIKNLLELKNARRVLIEGNLFEQNWQSGSAGYPIVFIPRNQSGGAPWSVVEEVTFRYNIVRHVPAGIHIHGLDDIHPPSGQTRAIVIRHNLFYDVDAAKWGGDGRFVFIGRAPRDIVIDHNTVIHSGGTLWAYGLESDPAFVIRQFVFTNNITLHGRHGIQGELAGGMGRRSINRYFPGGVVERNVLAGGRSADYDGENYFPSVSELMAQFVNADAGDYRLRDTSQFKSQARDGGALGADVDLLVRCVGMPPQPLRRHPRPSDCPWSNRQ